MAPENSLRGLGELLFVVALWGVPLSLLWISWHRYGAVRTAAGTNTSFAGASLALLFLSSGIWLLFYALVLISEYYKAVNSILSLVPNPRTLAVVNIIVCCASFILISIHAQDSPPNRTVPASHHFRNVVYATRLDVCPYRPLTRRWTSEVG